MAVWNHTIDDSDPVWKYSPYADGDFTGGWTPWFSGSGGFRNVNDAPGDHATGQSMHFTAFSGSSAILEFHGTAIYLYGSANCTYDVTLDSNTAGSSLPSSPSSNTLFVAEGLPLGTHFLNVTAHASTDQQFALDMAIISDELPGGVESLVPVVYDNTNSTVQYSGTWEVDNDNQIPSTAAPKPYHQTSASMASASLNFTGAAIAINGAVNWGHWTYNVTLDGVSRQFNSSTYWLVGNTQLFWLSGLDPSEPHQIELVNSAGAGMIMTLNDFTVYAPNVTTTGPPASLTSVSSTSGAPSPTDSVTSSSSSTTKVNAGVIVGPIIAGVFIFALVLGAFLWRRRRQMSAIAEATTAMPAPYYAGYSQSNIGEKSQTILSPLTPTLPMQSYRADMPSTVEEPFNPYANHSRTGSRVQLSQEVAPTDTRTQVRVLPTPPPLQPPQQPVDVDRIIELIAQRIDRPPARASEPPPRYPQ